MESGGAVPPVGVANAPMGPPAMRGRRAFNEYRGGFAYGHPGGYGVQGWYGNGEGYGGVGGLAAPVPAPATAPAPAPTPATTSAAPRPILPLDPASFVPLNGPYVDQSGLGPRNSTLKRATCLRCGRPLFLHCRQMCDTCESTKQWYELYPAGCSDYVQLHHSSTQYERLTPLNPWLLTHPVRIDEGSVAREVARGVKRKADDKSVEAEARRWHGYKKTVRSLRHNLAAAEKLQHEYLENYVNEMTLRFNAESAHETALDKVKEREEALEKAEKEKLSLLVIHLQLQNRAHDYKLEILSLKDELGRHDAAFTQSAGSRTPANAAPSSELAPVQRVKKEEEEAKVEVKREQHQQF